MIYRQIFILIFYLVLGPFSFIQASEIQDAYLEIQKIKDSETRIISELSLSALGLPREASTNRIRSLETLQALASDSPSDEYSFDIVLSHGHSAKELAQLIDAGNFQAITDIQIKFVEGELVRSIGLGGFDVYEGPTQKVLEFLIYEYRETSRVMINVMNAAGRDTSRNEDLIVKMRDIEAIRFYVVRGVMKASDAEALRQNNSSAVMNVRISRHNAEKISLPANFVQPTKKPLPIFDFNKPAPMSIKPGSGMMMKKEGPVSSSSGIVDPIYSLASLLFDSVANTLVPSAYAAISCSPANTCPPSSYWLPDAPAPWGSYIVVCIFGSCTAITSIITRSTFSSDDLRSYTDDSLTNCSPFLTGDDNAPCTVTNSAWVNEAGFEHQLSTKDWNCSILPWRSGFYSIDVSFQCLSILNYATNLPGDHYKGSTINYPAAS